MPENNVAAHPIEILYIEDDPGDIVLIKEGLKEIKIQISLNVVNDGHAALSYLKQEGVYCNAIRPDLIFLDLNLPGISGFDLLGILKNDKYFQQIPVVVLTTSEADKDIAKTYALGAACYVTKPVGFEAFSKIIKSIEGFWFTIVKYPPKN